jgi:hypothetical protein
MVQTQHLKMANPKIFNSSFLRMNKPAPTQFLEKPPHHEAGDSCFPRRNDMVL